MILEAHTILTRIRTGLTKDLAGFGGQVGLALILASDDPHAHRMLDLKIMEAQRFGINAVTHRFDTDISQDEVIATISCLNHDTDIHGIFVQAPLPVHWDADQIYASLDPSKDVDGYHPVNRGRLVTGVHGFVPVAPLGGVMMLKEHAGDLAGKRAVVVGCSDHVAKPLGLLLLGEGCTVTFAHIDGHGLIRQVGQSEILVAAVGEANFIKGHWIKSGALVLDMGANRIDGRIVGDVDYPSAEPIAGAINRPTGSIGPLTIALLLKQTVEAYKNRK